MTSSELRAEKNKLRTLCKKMRLEMDAGVRHESDSCISQRILDSLVFEWAENVLMYCPSKGEAGLLGVAEKALETGKRVYFPVSLDDGIMEFRRVMSTKDLTEGRYGIPEPSKDAELYVYDQNSTSLCFVPSLCVDKRGYRVGYGKGYYDRFLKECKETVFCAVQYDEMLFGEVPFDKRHDKKVDMIITQKGEYIIGQKEE